jgi:glutamyl-Q tRNA(Asp) synthetase
LSARSNISKCTVSQPVFRFAPSPNGRLHLGHAYSALLNERMAKESNGRFLLRIEDTDEMRCTPKLTQGVFEDLRWLGLTWEDPVRVQRENFDDYEHALQKLWEMDAIYPCFCSRKVAADAALSTKDPDGQPHYGGTCRTQSRENAERRMAKGDMFGWRLKTDGTDAAIWGDVMIAKRHVGSSYHIAVVVDDALQGITHVVRGKDLEAATGIHKQLQQRLGLRTPDYLHHELIKDDVGQKLSKSFKSRSLQSLREEGVTPQQIRQHLGFA